eukprot:UN19381
MKLLTVCTKPKSKIQYCVSYHPSDEKFALKLQQSLQGQDHNVWKQDSDRSERSSYWQKIAAGATRILRLISEKYIANARCIDEFAYAENRNRGVDVILSRTRFRIITKIIAKIFKNDLP